jgi:hypothetical protein
VRRVLAADLPNWFDLDALKTTVVVLAGVALLAAIVVLARVRDPRVKFVSVIALLGICAGLVYYRAELDDCEKTCSCKFIFDYPDTDGCPER